MIDKVVIKGNDCMYEYVVCCQFWIFLGKKFSCFDIICLQWELMNFNYFNLEMLGINMLVNLQWGIVDIEYMFEEKFFDQLEFFVGWGGFQGVIGMLGVLFNNFFMCNFFNKEVWCFLLQGDGQCLLLCVQINGVFFQFYNVIFIELWLGGKKFNFFIVVGFYNKFLGSFSRINLSSLSIVQLFVSFGKCLRWLDDNFVISIVLNLQ